MNVPLTDSLGLCIYRELMHREQNALATWHLTYGPEAINKAPNPDSMLNMGKFSKISSMPMPLNVQLQSVKAERRAQSAKITRYERSIFPQRSDVPVSESSVKIFGDAAWHSQPKKSTGAPATFQPYVPPHSRFGTKRVWDVDRIQYVRESLGPASQAARRAAEGPTAAWS